MATQPKYTTPCRTCNTSGEMYTSAHGMIPCDVCDGKTFLNVRSWSIVDLLEYTMHPSSSQAWGSGVFLEALGIDAEEVTVGQLNRLLPKN